MFRLPIVALSCFVLAAPVSSQELVVNAPLQNGFCDRDADVTCAAVEAEFAEAIGAPTPVGALAYRLVVTDRGRFEVYRGDPLAIGALLAVPAPDNVGLGFCPLDERELDLMPVWFETADLDNDGADEWIARYASCAVAESCCYRTVIRALDETRTLITDFDTVGYQTLGLAIATREGESPRVVIETSVMPDSGNSDRRDVSRWVLEGGELIPWPEAP